MTLTIQEVIDEHVRLEISLSQTHRVIQILFRGQIDATEIVRRYRDAVTKQKSDCVEIIAA